MTPEIEAALKTWLEGEGISPVFTGLDSANHPSDAQTVTIFVSEAPRATGPLYRATCNFIVATPPQADDDLAASLAAHRATASQLRALLESPDSESLSNALESVAALYYRGGWLRDGGASTVDDGKWLTTFDFVAGISTSPSA